MTTETPIHLKVLASCIRKSTPKKYATAVQFGCQTYLSSNLSKNGFKVFVIDSNPEEVISSAAESEDATFVLGDPIDLKDILNSRRDIWAKDTILDVIYHDNFMSRFNYAEAIEFIKLQSELAYKILFSVPTKNLPLNNPNELTSDDWIRPQQEWDKVITEAGIKKFSMKLAGLREDYLLVSINTGLLY